MASIKNALVDEAPEKKPVKVKAKSKSKHSPEETARLIERAKGRRIHRTAMREAYFRRRRAAGKPTAKEKRKAYREKMFAKRGDLPLG